MVIDDVASLPTSPLVVAEGSTLPASAVAQGIAQRSRALWLLPTEDFHERQLATRSTTGGPLLLYRLLREVVEREAIEQQVPSITVDATRGEAEMVAVVEEVFTDALAAGPARRDEGGALPPAAGTQRGGRWASARLLRPPVGPGRPKCRETSVPLRVRRSGL